MAQRENDRVLLPRSPSSMEGVPLPLTVPLTSAADSGTDTDEDGQLIQKAVEVVRKPVKVEVSKPKKVPKRSGGSSSLRTLIEEGFLLPAEDVLTLEYKGMTTNASLTVDGRIMWRRPAAQQWVHHFGAQPYPGCDEDQYFESPSAFSIFLKRLVNPSRKADDGWKTIRYAGKYLDAFKMEMFLRRAQAREEEEGQGPQPLSVSGPTNAISALSDGPYSKPQGDAESLRVCTPTDLSGSQQAKSSPHIQEGHIRPPTPPVLPPTSSSGTGILGVKRPRGEMIGMGPQAEPRQGQTLGRIEAAREVGRRSVEERRSKVPHIVGPVAPQTGHSAVFGDPLLAPTHYWGTPGDPTPGAQAFRVEVAPSVEVVMEFHGRITDEEVFGLLGGRWEGTRRLLKIEEALPIAGKVDSSTGVWKMDVGEEAKGRAVIQEHHLTVVGWYRSRPHTSVGAPSMLDVRYQLHNQVAQMALQRPFVGVVLAQHASEAGTNIPGSMTWFNVDWDTEGARAPPDPTSVDLYQPGMVVMALAVEPLLDKHTVDKIMATVDVMRTLTEKYLGSPGAARPGALETDPSVGVEELLVAVKQRLPDRLFSVSHKEQFCTLVRSLITSLERNNPSSGGTLRGPSRSLEPTQEVKHAAARAPNPTARLPFVLPAHLAVSARAGHGLRQPGDIRVCNEVSPLSATDNDFVEGRYPSGTRGDEMGARGEDNGDDEVTEDEDLAHNGAAGDEETETEDEGDSVGALSGWGASGRSVGEFNRSSVLRGRGPGRGSLRMVKGRFAQADKPHIGLEGPAGVGTLGFRPPSGSIGRSALAIGVSRAPPSSRGSRGKVFSRAFAGRSQEGARIESGRGLVGPSLIRPVEATEDDVDSEETT